MTTANLTTLVSAILNEIGQLENIDHCTHCMTRLRLTLKQAELVNMDKLKATSGVLGVVNSSDQLQIILGPGKVQQVADNINQQLKNSPSSSAPVETPSLDELASQNKTARKSQQNSAIHHFLSKFAAIFTPLIPGFIAAGLLLGIATLLQQNFVTGNAHPNQYLVDSIAYMSVFSKGLFTFLSILVGYNTQQVFGGSGVNGAIIAALFVLGYDPHATTGFYSGMNQFFGLTIDPRGNIIGVLIAGILGAWIERQVRKIIPATLDMILTSGITLLIMGAITFTIIMPIGKELFVGMSWLFVHLNSNPIGSAILAGLFLIAVVFGVHQGFIPVYISLMATQGFNSLFPILAMAGGGQVGAALALFMRAPKGSTLRNQIRGAIIPGILGIGEPLIYGVTLPRIKPFITACLGGSAGGFFIGLLAYLGFPMGLNTVFGPSGITAIPLMTSHTSNMEAILIYSVGLLISYLTGYLITYYFGCKDVDLT